jgi:hypothetical protein
MMLFRDKSGKLFVDNGANDRDKRSTAETVWVSNATTPTFPTFGNSATDLVMLHTAAIRL